MAEDEPPFPAMAPPEITELSEDARERQSALKQDAADALEDGKRELAMEKLTAAIALGCPSALMYSRRGQLLLHLGRPFAAVNDCTAALLLDSEVASAYKTRARALCKLEQWADAQTDFEEALQLDYDEATYQESLKASSRADPSADAAAPELAPVAPLEAPFPPMSPPDVTTLTEEVQDEQIGLKQECSDAVEDGDLDVALEKMTEAIVLGCASASMYCTRADLLLKLERPRAAINDCGAALARDPDSAKAFRLRARALGAMEQWMDAYSSYQEALRLEDDEGTQEEAREVMARLDASALLAAGVKAAGEEAGPVPLDVPEMDPGPEPPFPPLAPPEVLRLSEEARDRQAELQQACAEALEVGDEAVALEEICKAIALGCATAMMYSRRGQLLLQLDRPRAAVRDCSAALSLNPQSEKALKVRARAYAAIEHWHDAQADYDEALRLNHDTVVYEESVAVAMKIAQLKEASRLAARRRWEIVGGGDKGGLVVRDGLDLRSPQILDPLDGVSPHRIALGATVAEVELVGDRLHYQKLTGSGPSEGWISIALVDKVLAIPMASAPTADASQEVAVAGAEEPPFPPMAPAGVESLSEEGQDRQAALKQQAVDALEDGDLQLALERFTGAIIIGCASALLFCRRAQVLLQLNRPRAAINDCSAALGINPDSGKAFKIRARAQAKLKRWVEAHADFQEGLRIDYDEDTYQESLSVEEKMKGIKAIATGKRLQVEQDRIAKAAAQEKEAEDLKRRLEQQLAREKAQEDQKMLTFKKMYMSDQFGKVAWSQGYMTDFMGIKRGKCKKCKNCPIYCWTPVRMSS